LAGLLSLGFEARIPAEFFFLPISISEILYGIRGTVPVVYCILLAQREDRLAPLYEYEIK
jgi:hypothetical protein